jgi:ketosteroid isomerase-like protein
MTSRIAKIVGVSLVLLIISGLKAQTSQDVKNKDVPEFLRQLAGTRNTIADGYVRWVQAVKSKDIDGVLAAYSEDAMILPDGHDAVSGKSAIREFYAELFAKSDGLKEERFENINSVQVGNLLIDSTRFSGTLIRDGKEVRLKGNRLVVWKRDFQGPWMILRDTWNRSEP